MHPNISSLLLLLLAPIPFLLPVFVHCEDEKYANCPIFFECGKIIHIGYPFWGNGRPEYCGHPGFKLDCLEDKVGIEIMSHKYHVLDIIHQAQLLKMARIDLAENICPDQYYTDTTLDSNLFNYTSNDLTATLLYNCLPFAFEHPMLATNNKLSCQKENNTRNSSYFVIKTYPTNAAALRCEFSVMVMVLNTAVQDLKEYRLDIHQVLNQGFEVGWIVDEARCKDCIKSGGRCGYNSTLVDFSCFCPDRAYARTCFDSPAPKPPNSLPPQVAPGSGPNVRRKLIIGFGSAGISILAMTLIFFIYQRRNKRRYASSFYLSRNMSYNPSSITDLEKMDSKYFGVHIFSYSELEEATNKFDSTRELGDGGFGTVYYGKLRDGRDVAVKRLYENNYKRVEQFMNEVEILTRLRHPYLVSLYGCTSRHSRELLLVYEYVPNGTVADHLHGERAKPGSLPWSTRVSIAIETATALTYLHASDIIHRDVKTNNILLDNNFYVKVADFGLSRLFPTDVTHVSTAPQGTPGYVDPDYHQCYQLTVKSDVFSFGVVLIELISSKPAVDITRHRHEINLSNMAINRIKNHALHELVDPCLGFESDCKVREMIIAVAELAFECLQNEKEMRPSMEQVLERLKDIQIEVYNVGKAEVMDIPAEDIVLLKSCHLLPSPDSGTTSSC